MKACNTLSASLILFHRTILPLKFGLSLSIFLLMANIVFAGTFYSNNANPSATINWWSNTNGTGSNPSNFTTSGDIFILQSGQTCATASDWTIGSGVTLQVDGILSINGNNDDVIVNGTIIFTNTSATQVTLSGGGAGTTITINGVVKTANINGLQGTNCSLPANAAKKTATLNAAATYEFNSTAAQAIAGLPATVSNLNVNNSNCVDINTSITVSNTLTLANGILNIFPGSTVNITSGNAIAGSGFGNTKHINTRVNTSTGAQGFIRVGNISSTYTFPSGDGTNYLPVILTPSATNDFSVNVFQGATTNGTPNGTAFSNAIKQKMVDAIWTVNRNSGTGNVTMQISWTGALEGSTFSGIANSSIGISHYGGVWDATSGYGDQALNTATRSAISSFSPFLVGEISSPLPLKFGNIKVYSTNNGSQIEWTSLAEMNVSHYEIERSQDGQQFSTTGQVRASGNNTASINYSWFDNAPLSGTSYYRIKAVDIDGKYNYSNIVKTTMDQLQKNFLSLYPNPVQNNHVMLEVGNVSAGQYRFLIYDMTGKQVYMKSFNHPGGAFTEDIQLPTGIHHGIYNIKLGGKDVSIVKTFVVQ